MIDIKTASNRRIAEYVCDRLTYGLDISIKDQYHIEVNKLNLPTEGKRLAVIKLVRELIRG